MSKARVLVKFQDGAVVHGCYNGTCDVLSPWLITEEDLEAKYNGDVFDFYEDDKRNYEHYKEIAVDKVPITDAELVEIFIDYGGGFMWENCTASKSKLYVTSPTGDWDNTDLGYIQEWVYRYYQERGWYTDWIKDQVIPDAKLTAIEMTDDE